MCWPCRDFKKLYISGIWNFALTEFDKIFQFVISDWIVAGLPTLWYHWFNFQVKITKSLCYFFLQFILSCILCNMQCMKIFATFKDIFSNLYSKKWFIHIVKIWVARKINTISIASNNLRKFFKFWKIIYRKSSLLLIHYLLLIIIVKIYKSV